MSNQDQAASDYLVVVNHEEQYSIWPQGRDLPSGWAAEGKVGSKEQCLAHIEEAWVDMRPLSVRKFLEANLAPAAVVTPVAEPAGSPLLELLAREQPVELLPSAGEEVPASALRHAHESGWAYIRFPETDTRLGFKIEATRDQASTPSNPDFPVVLRGELTLNFQRVVIECSFSDSSLAGRGRLSALSPSP